MSTWAEIRARHDARVFQTRTAQEEIGLASSRRFVAMLRDGALLRVELVVVDEVEEREREGWKIRAHDTEERARAAFDRIEQILVANAMSVVSMGRGIVALVP